MTTIFSFDVKGSQWKALGGEGAFGFVCIPSNAIPALSDAEIVRFVRESARQAELAQAAAYAGNYMTASERELDYHIKYMGEESARRNLELFEQFADEYVEIAQMASRFRAALERINKRMEARKRVKTIRRTLSKDYTTLFYRVGKRDGFKCQHCGSTDDLTLDHIMPAIAGGESKYENLQILCRSCNSRKGAK